MTELELCEWETCIRFRGQKSRLCVMHRARKQRGMPMDQPPRIIGDIDARFWSKVGYAAAIDCWPWSASLNDGGYGQFMVDGKPQRAHRIAWELLRGEIPHGLVIDHLCRNRWCVNPWHMEPVTNEENIARGLFLVTRPPQRTVCPSGHRYEGDNVRIDPQGYQRCRACERKQSLESYYRRKERQIA